MPQQMTNGWIANFPPNSDFEVIEHRKGKDISHRPTGVFIHADWQRVYLNYAGIHAPLVRFQLPLEPEVLRDVADALRELAADLEMKQGR